MSIGNLMPSPEHLILASGSRYRRELLERLQIPFNVISADIDESRRIDESAHDLALRLAEEKARAVLPQAKDAWIIGSDQTLALGEEILGKPGTHENAVAQLQKLSGQAVCFYTSLCLISDAGRVQTDMAIVNVKFRKLELAEIEAYLEREPAYDCAGSCKAEGLGISMVERIESDDPTALIGLPLIRLRRMLADAGCPLP